MTHDAILLENRQNVFSKRYPRHIVRRSGRTHSHYGDYERREEDKRASLFEEFRKSSRAYSDTFASSRDPLISFLRDVGDQVAAAGDTIMDIFRSPLRDDDNDKDDSSDSSAPPS